MFPERYCHAPVAAAKSCSKIFALFRRRLAPLRL
jgi:hypothetical protein